MNTYRPREQVKYTVEALVLHETVPGHHLQVGLARELEGVPTFRTVFQRDRLQRGVGALCRVAGRARWASSIAIRRRGSAGWPASASAPCGWWWTPASTPWAGRAIRRAPTSSSTPPASRWPRWIATSPGRARRSAYKIGQLKIQELRRRAEQALGSRFDIRAFHDAVLRNGALPLDMLEEQVTAYIKDAQAR